MTRAPKVVHLTEALIDPRFGSGGGMQLSLSWLARVQQREGWDVEIWLLESKPDAPAGFSIPVRTVPPYDHRRPDHLWRLAARLRRAGATVLHTHGYWAGAVGRPAALLAGVPIRIHKMASAYRAEYRWTHRLTERALSRISYRVIAVSEDVRDFLLQDVGVRPEKIAVIANGTPRAELPSDRGARRASLGLGAGNFVIASLSRLTAGKGLTELIGAVAALAGEPAPRILFAGDGPMRQELERLAQSRLGKDGARFLGWVDKVGDVLGVADAFVLGSEEREGFSTALVQAMAAGVPIVATRVGGNREAIEHGVSGFLVPPRDEKALAEALGSLRASPELRLRFSAAEIRRYEENYRLEITAGRVLDLYRTALRECGR